MFGIFSRSKLARELTLVMEAWLEAKLWLSKSLANISLEFNLRAGRGAIEARLRLRKRSLPEKFTYVYNITINITFKILTIFLESKQRLERFPTLLKI